MFFFFMVCRAYYMSCIVCCSYVFFKQKTAYEMRISDWSSDVCSSDLLPWRRGLVTGAGTHHGLDRQVVLVGELEIALVVGRNRDRKSVVSGKSVSVRVDLGGRRIIKKKSKKRNEYV